MVCEWLAGINAEHHLVHVFSVVSCNGIDVAVVHSKARRRDCPLARMVTMIVSLVANLAWACTTFWMS